MYRHGLEIDAHIIADGRLHRFHVPGDRKGTKNGWYILYADFPTVGVFGCWKRHIKRYWQPNKNNSLTVADLRKIKERANDLQVQLDREFKAELAALRESEDLWHNTKPATNNHSYLVWKGVRSHGLRYHQGALLVPLSDPDGNFHGLQRIWQNGDKRFHKGTITTGHFHIIGEANMATLLVCEGYSTGATLHEITGHAVIVAFGCGNLRPVAEAVRAAWPTSRIIICADDDYNEPDNPGMSAAVEAAATINAELIVPQFPSTRGVTDSDFNDLFRLSGPTPILEYFNGKGVHHDNV